MDPAKARIIGILLIPLVLLALAGCRIRIHSVPTPTPEPTPEPQVQAVLGIIESPNPDGLPIGPFIGGLAPNFRLETLDGDTLVLSDLRGKPVFLNFFTVWCGPCRFELPEMEKVHQKFGD
ncbi:MAG: TlpA family protein disulfide reductase, partial [Dehalococcoidia bacterium]